MLGITIKKESMKIAKYTGERRVPNLEIKRHFTYPNLSPYEKFEYKNYYIKLIRDKVKSISDDGIDLGYFEELEACYFEDELAYMMIKKMVDIDIKNINLKKFIEFNKRFNIDSYKQAANIIAIALSITNDAISR